MAGAKAIWRSAAGMAAWQQVITHPEAVDEWAPASLGVKRADRVDPSHMYQKTDFSLLGGLVHIQQQAVTGILWDSSSAQRFSNCWWVEDPAGWTQVAPLRSDKVPAKVLLAQRPRPKAPAVAAAAQPSPWPDR